MISVRSLSTTVIITLVLTVIMACHGESFALDDELQHKSPAANAVYTEMFGQGGLLSINYDRLVAPNMSFHIGISTLLIGYGVPVGLSYLTSGNNKFEIGAGALYADIDFIGKTRGIAGSAVLGYRHQRDEGGFLFRAGFTPFFSTSGVFPFGGISFGYSF